ncbi:hypothetical protein AgCh_014389 [Apium graveolens]
MIWLSHVKNYAFVAARVGSVLSLSTAICLVPFVHGLTLAALHASKVNVIAREVLVNVGYHYYLQWL